MAELFDVDDLRKLLQESVDEFDTDAATVARRYAGGWLSDATGLAVWPDPVPDRLWAWGVELAAIAYRNPEAAESQQTDDYRVVYDRARRGEILAAARAAFPPPGGSGSPQWSFPPPERWPWDTTRPALPGQ